MPILLKRRNGEIIPFRNAEFIPAYYFIPKSMLAQCGAELRNIPRNPRKLLLDWKAIATVESDLFQLLIIDAYAFMAWSFMGLGAKREIYSGYEPSWILAHSPAYWIQEMTDEKILPTPKELLNNGGLDFDFGYVSEAEIENFFDWLVPQAMAHHNMKAVIETAKEYRCFEDFDHRRSRQKTDFFREWYHTRTKHPQISLESFQEDYENAHDDMEWDVTDESLDLELEAVDQVQVDTFLKTLSEKDGKILKMRMDGFTLEESADKLGYANHSGVLKRIRKIGQAYEKFAGVDYGFHGNKIV